ncbi:hypothetical protein IAI43_12135, partial [Streptococcus pseudopneumoniae]|nr:hypothetical protein [Streptococcus pseudopneumoniae]
MIKEVTEDLKPIFEQLKAEGYKVYSYETHYNPNDEIDSLYWFENGRVLSVQPNTWRNIR